jgi:hypothetical protein
MNAKRRWLSLWSIHPEWVFVAMQVQMILTGSCLASLTLKAGGKKQNIEY